MRRVQGAGSRVPATAGWGILVAAASMAAFWGSAEFFHEGWYEPFGRTLPLYLMPAAVLAVLALFALRYPAPAGVVVVGSAVAFTTWRYVRLGAMHAPIVASLWIVGVVLALPGVLLLLGRWRPTGAAARRRALATVAAPVAVALAVGLPLLVRNLGRVPLESRGEVTVSGGGVALTFAGEGPGWLASRDRPVMFEGRRYVGLSWNEIALFGMEPLGFEGKRFGPGYDGTPGSVRNATVEEFRRYNMFRFIDPEGRRLTRTLHDAWRLPGAAELVAVLQYRGACAGGRFDPAAGRAWYERTPDKDAPIWDPGTEVVYYWTATEAGPDTALDLSYSGRVRPVLKTSAQDYRGFRAVRTGAGGGRRSGAP